MKHLTRDEVEVERLLRAARSVAVLGASARPGDRNEAVVAYLKQAGFDVFPVREDRADVAGLASWARLADVPGPLDIVLLLPASRAEPATIEETARKGARLLWLAPGVPVAAAREHAAMHGLLLVHDRDIVVEHRHTEQAAGHPRKRGVNVGGRRRSLTALDRTRADDTGYVVGGGGGHKGGGGGRTVLDEKKMVGGRPRRRGRRDPG